MAFTDLKSAISAQGGTRAVASALGISRQAMEQWREVPAKRVLQLEKILNVPRHVLRPDLYPIEVQS